MKRTHGKTGTNIYQTWLNMKQRCQNPKCPEYIRYGARGIKVHKDWLSFENFYADVRDAPAGMSLDRIRNNEDYGPQNWKWSTPKEQGGNRRDNVFLTFKGKKMHLSDWARELSMSHATLWHRVKIGLPIKAILNKERLDRISERTEQKIKQFLLKRIPCRKIAKELGIGANSVFERRRKLLNSYNDGKGVKNA